MAATTVCCCGSLSSFSTLVDLRMIRFIKILALAIFIFTPSLLDAQKTVSLKKRFKEAQTSIKKASGQEDIERILLDSLTSPTTDISHRAYGYHLCALLQQSINDALNVKAYLKEDIDTVKFFKTVYNIYNHTLRSDSADNAGKYSARNNRLRDTHRKNLLGGGKFQLRKANWDEAYEYFDMFLTTRTTDSDSIVGNVSYWATVCGMNANAPHKVLKYVDLAISEASLAEASALSEYKARSFLALGDTVAWVKVLDEGTNRYPGYSYFFLNLMDYYMRHGMAEVAMVRTDSLIRTDGDRAMYWLAMSMFALAEKEYETCVKMSEECLNREPDNVDALYNKGISLLNMALKEEKTTRRRVLYRKALVPMEKVRELQPNELERWGNPLYRIYLNLNMGDKFREIDGMMEKVSYSTDDDTYSDAVDVMESEDDSNELIDKSLSE